MSNDSPLAVFKRSHQVICPSCAGKISIMTPESFTLRPNNKFRGHLNSLIVDMRNFTRGLDAYLTVHTTALPLHDVFGTPYARAEILSLINLGLIEMAALKDQYPDPGGDGRFPDAVEEYIEQQTTADGRAESTFINALEQTYNSRLKPEMLNHVYNSHGEFVSIRSGDAPQKPESWQKPKVRIWSEYFESQIDTHDFAQNFKDLKNWPEETRSIPPEQAKKAAKLLLGVGLERRVNGLVFDLALEQPAMRDFLRVHMTEATGKLISAILDILRPSLNSYYKKLDAVLNLPDQERVPFFNDVQKPLIADNIRRARLLLLLLHGHAWRTVSEDLKKLIKGKHTEALTSDFESLFLSHLWVIDEQVVIQPQLLSRMLNSKHFFDQSNLALGEALHAHESRHQITQTGSVSFLNRLRSFFFKAFKKRNNTGQGVTEVGERNFAWLQHVEQIVNVHCNSEIETRKDFIKPTNISALARLASFVQKRKGKDLESKIVFSPCDYQLTNEKTFSLVILGSMGSGKTCAFNSAIATLWRYSESLFVDLEPTDAESLLKMEKIRDDHLNGEIDLPTDRNFTLNLKVRSLPSASQHSSRVSILDIPGETVFSLISGTGADSELRRIMKSANAVVFLYDLWSDTAFSADVKKSNAAQFKEALDNAENTNKVRENRQGTAVDQRMLLQKLYGLLKEERTEEELRNLPFVCVFPKADLLRSDSNSQAGSAFVLNEFARELETAGIFIKSQQPGANAAAGLRSCAGLKPKPEALKSLFSKYYPDAFNKTLRAGGESEPFDDKVFNPVSLEKMVEYQLELAGLLSRMFDSVVDAKLKDMVGQREEAEQLPFTSRIQGGVFAYIQERFDQCFFLPASALGKSPAMKNDKFEPLGQMPNSQLIEYTMLIPILVSIRESLGRDKTGTQATTDSGDNPGGQSEPAAGAAPRASRGRR